MRDLDARRAASWTSRDTATCHQLATIAQPDQNDPEAGRAPPRKRRIRLNRYGSGPGRLVRDDRWVRSASRAATGTGRRAGRRDRVEVGDVVAVAAVDLAPIEHSHDEHRPQDEHDEGGRPQPRLPARCRRPSAPCPDSAWFPSGSTPGGSGYSTPSSNACVTLLDQWRGNGRGTSLTRQTQRRWSSRLKLSTIACIGSGKLNGGARRFRWRHRSPVG